jgi:hypothetical protein
VSAIFQVPPALGALGVLQPPDPLVVLVLILGGISCGLICRDIRELLIVVFGTQLIVIHVVKGGYVDLTIWRVISRMAVLE